MRPPPWYVFAFIALGAVVIVALWLMGVEPPHPTPPTPEATGRDE